MTAIWALINFIILIGAIWWFARKPIGQAMDSRREAIAEALRIAEEARVAAEQTLARQRELVANAETELAAIAAQTRSMAEAMARDITETARQEAARALELARAEVEVEKQSALASLHREVARMAFEAAERAVVARLDAEKQRELVQSFKERVGERPLALK